MVVAVILMDIAATEEAGLLLGPTLSLLQQQIAADECSENVASCEWSGNEGSLTCICGTPIETRWDSVFHTFLIGNYKAHTMRKICVNKRKQMMEVSNH